MQVVQSGIFLLAALLALGGALAVATLSSGPAAWLWTLQLVGLGVVFALLATSALAPDRPVTLKRSPRSEHASGGA
ncbi:MAG: hypothetical protein K6U89_02020 [Chloroflexi bacterium]|nr:hypothetical protein [Chloroflexota bacterium]